MLNQDKIESFLKNIEFIKQNQQYLESNLNNSDENIKIIKPLEVKSMNIENKVK